MFPYSFISKHTHLSGMKDFILHIETYFFGHKFIFAKKELEYSQKFPTFASKKQKKREMFNRTYQ